MCSWCFCLEKKHLFLLIRIVQRCWRPVLKALDFLRRSQVSAWTFILSLWEFLADGDMNPFTAVMLILCCCLKCSAAARWLSKWRLWRHAGGDAEWWCGRIWSELILVPGSSFSRQCSSDELEETTIQRWWCEGRSRIRFCFRRSTTGGQHDQHELPKDWFPDSSDHNTVLESPWINWPFEKQFACFPPFRYMKIASRKSVKVCANDGIIWHCLIKETRTYSWKWHFSSRLSTKAGDK